MLSPILSQQNRSKAQLLLATQASSVVVVVAAAALLLRRAVPVLLILLLLLRPDGLSLALALSYWNPSSLLLVRSYSSLFLSSSLVGW